MNFQQAVKGCFEKYADFEGRAPRSEYWWWVLFCALTGIAAAILDAAIFGVHHPAQAGPINALANLALFLPSLAVTIRRLHDVDRSGWWFLIVFTGIGAFVLLYWYCKKSDDGINRFGAAT